MTMTKDENRDLRADLNEIHNKLLNAPKELKYTYQLSIGSVLNAYREGDASHEEAEREIVDICKRQMTLAIDATELA